MRARSTSSCPGPTRHADRRLRLRPPHDRRPSPSAAGRSPCDELAERLSDSRCRRARATRRACSRRFPTAHDRAGRRPRAGCAARRSPARKPRGCGSWRSCIIPCRSRQGSTRTSAARSRRPNAGRLQSVRHVIVVTSAPRRRCWPHTASAADRDRSSNPGTDPAPLARAARAAGRPAALRRDVDSRARAMTCCSRARRRLPSPSELAADVRRQPRARPGDGPSGCARIVGGRARRACRVCRREGRRGPGRALRRRGRLRAADPVRRVRHGGRRGAGTRAAGRCLGNGRHCRTWSHPMRASWSRRATPRRWPPRSHA